MPIWTYIYLAILTLSSLYSLKLFRGIAWFWLGETLALCFVYAFFFFAYTQTSLPDDFIYPLLMLVYIFYWEHWVYKNFFAFLMPEHIVSSKELLFMLLLTFSPLLYVVVKVLQSYAGVDI